MSLPSCFRALTGIVVWYYWGRGRWLVKPHHVITIVTEEVMYPSCWISSFAVRKVWKAENWGSSNFTHIYYLIRSTGNCVRTFSKQRRHNDSGGVNVKLMTFQGSTFIMYNFLSSSFRLYKSILSDDVHSLLFPVASEMWAKQKKSNSGSDHVQTYTTRKYKHIVLQLTSTRCLWSLYL
jgi:hypothetical protein